MTVMVTLEFVLAQLVVEQQIVFHLKEGEELELAGRDLSLTGGWAGLGQGD